MDGAIRTPHGDRRRVVVIPTWYPNERDPGSGVFVREHARALREVADVIVIHPETGQAARSGAWDVLDGVEEGVRTIRVRVRRPRDRGLTVFLQVSAIRAVLRRLRGEGWRPDVVHAHVFAAGFLALCVRPRSVPVVVSEHFSGIALGEVRGLDRQIARSVFSRADAVAPVSDNLAMHVRKLAPRGRVVVVPNAVDVDRFHPRAGPRRPGPFRLLAVAGLVEVKQLTVLLDALGQVQTSSRGPFELRIAGDGPLRARLEQAAREHGIEAAVRFLGRCTSPRVAELMRDSDAVVLPSRWENLPVVLIEAMASGLPAIATRVGGVPELVDEDVGVLVSPGDATALAAAIIDVADRLARFDPAALHERAASRYGFSAVAAAWAALYQDLIASRAA